MASIRCPHCGSKLDHFLLDVVEGGGRVIFAEGSGITCSSCNERIYGWQLSRHINEPLDTYQPKRSWIERFRDRSAKKRALAQRGEEQRALVQDLVNAAASDDRKVLVETVKALEVVGSASTPWLVEALRNESAIARAVVADVLGRVGDERAVRILKAALDDPDDGVREMATSALERIESRGMTPT